MTTDKQRAVLGRVSDEVHNATLKASRLLGQSVSQFVEAAVIEKLSRSSKEIVSASAALDDEVMRLSSLADQITQQSTGRRASSDA